MFKRRKTDDPISGETATLAAGLPDSEADTDRIGAQESHGSGADSGLGVPPFRPAQPKEPHLMARPPFTPAQPAPAGAAPPAQRPGLAPTPGAISSRIPTRDPSERRTLVVGRGISVQGTVQDAERLVVEGTVEASMIHATELAVAPGGMFKGEVEVEDAEIAGTINGTLTARNSLTVRATGKVMGTARCKRLQVEDGGQISGQMEMLSDSAKPEQPRIVHETVASV
ncbi:MAG: bactofilin family protein [Acetobacteraceae bacterium]